MYTTKSKTYFEPEACYSEEMNMVKEHVTIQLWLRKLNNLSKFYSLWASRVQQYTHVLLELF